jgi:hypothetical protein
VAKKKKQVIFSVTDYFGNLVECDEYTWNVHILDPVDGHPQMAGYENLVMDVLRSPYEIRSSTQHSTGVAFISAAGVGPSADGIRTLVNYASTSYEKGSTIGNVMTAYPVDWVKYASPQLGKIIKAARKTP